MTTADGQPQKVSLIAVQLQAVSLYPVCDSTNTRCDLWQQRVDTGPGRWIESIYLYHLHINVVIDRTVPQVGQDQPRLQLMLNA